MTIIDEDLNLIWSEDQKFFNSEFTMLLVFVETLTELFYIYIKNGFDAKIYAK